MTPLVKTRNNRLKWGLVGVVMAMIGVSFLSVPLYELFCQVTGWSGTPGRYAEGDRRAEEGAFSDGRRFTVQFDANVSPEMPWEFGPVQRDIEVGPGEETIIHYRAHNPTAGPVTGTASFNVAPFKFGIYFVKVECFCFTEQVLAAGESIDMPVKFYIDPEIVDDDQLDDVTKVTLSYTLYRMPDEG